MAGIVPAQPFRSAPCQSPTLAATRRYLRGRRARSARRRKDAAAGRRARRPASARRATPVGNSSATRSSASGLEQQGHCSALGGDIAGLHPHAHAVTTPLSASPCNMAIGALDDFSFVMGQDFRQGVAEFRSPKPPSANSFFKNGAADDWSTGDALYPSNTFPAPIGAYQKCPPFRGKSTSWNDPGRREGCVKSGPLARAKV